MDPVGRQARIQDNSPAEGRSISPFFSRSYGGYTAAQETFFRQALGPLDQHSILDPMAGQGFALCRLSWQGIRVSLGDLNPATLLLAVLRDPQILGISHVLSDWVVSKLLRLKKNRTRPELKYVQGWIPESIKEQLV